MLTTFSGRPASQDEFELRAFIVLLRSLGVKRFLEIGSRHGDTLHEIAINLPAGSTIVGVDLPGGLWGQKASRPALNAAVADLCARGYKASCLFGDSQTDATRRLVVGRGPYDAALIDGDHTYAGVVRDWDNYRSVAPIIALHDIVGDGQAEKVNGNPVQVPRLWSEIKASGLATIELVAPGSKMGIGCVIPS